MASKIKAGDIIRLADGSVEYVFDLGKDGLGTNACNESWIERGLSTYGSECYKLTRDEYREAVVIGHSGNGSMCAGAAWYEEWLAAKKDEAQQRAEKRAERSRHAR